MKRFHYASLTAATLLVAASFAGTVASGSQKIADAEGLECAACHDKPGSKLLTDRGKYYESMGTLEGFEALAESFGKCTSCHVKKPGSLKLTKKGKEFQELVGDMKGLQEWMAAHHPMPPPAEPGGGTRP